METFLPHSSVPQSKNPIVYPEKTRSFNLSTPVENSKETLESALLLTKSTGLLVLNDGVISTEKYWLGANKNDRFTSWSVAKSVVSLLVGIAVDQKLIESIDDPVGKYLPEFRESKFKSVPIRNLLDMNSGIVFSEVYDNIFSDIDMFFVKVFYLGWRAYEPLQDLDYDASTLGEFHYKSVNSQLLGMIVASAAKKSLSQFAQENLWEPLGTEYPIDWITDHKSGIELSFCCLNMNLRDYAKIGQLVIERGSVRGRQIVSLPWMTSLLESYEFRKMKKPHPFPYHQHWWVPESNEQEVMAIGIWGQYIYANPSRRTVIVKVSADPNYDHNDLLNLNIFRTLMKM